MTDPRKAFEQYIAELFTEEDEALKTIYASPEKHDMPMISIRSYEGSLLQWLIRLIGAKTIVEIGTLAGYSTVWMARALPSDGKLYAVEKSSKHAAVARENFALAGVSDRIELLQGNSQDLLPRLANKAPFDLVFIDADKAGYPYYLSWAVDNLRVGGLVVAHNAYRHGGIITLQSDDDRAMDTFNRALASHPKLDSMIIPLGDAMAIGVRRA
jgi:caffeoyl-CoA O-methyltransferase